jgi:hypothetical protein
MPTTAHEVYISQLMRYSRAFASDSAPLVSHVVLFLIKRSMIGHERGKEDTTATTTIAAYSSHRYFIKVK